MHTVPQVCCGDSCEKPSGGLFGRLVRLVNDGDSAKRRAGSAAYERSRREGLHAAVAEWKLSGVSDSCLYQRTKAWLNHRFKVLDEHCDTEYLAF